VYLRIAIALALFVLNIPFQFVSAQNQLPADTSFVVINRILVAGNKVTKEKIIRRELLFTEGDTVANSQLDELLNKTKDNLFNTSLFNFITIKIIDDQPQVISIFILLEERWYLWPYPIFEQADRNLSSYLHQGDWSKINYGLLLIKNNFRGRGEQLKLKFRLGYKEQFQVMYENPYLFANRKHGLITEYAYYRQHEIAYQTQNDRLYYFKDENNYVQTYQTGTITYQFRNKIYTTHRLGLGFSLSEVSDTIALLNPDYFNNQTNTIRYLTLNYTFDNDKRNYKKYPLTGYNTLVSLTQSGLGILTNEMPGSLALESSYYLYSQLSDHWFSGLGGKIKISTNDQQPYFFQRGLGYADYLRSFEYQVIDGQHFITTRSFIKYAIIPMNITSIESWSWTKFNKIHYSLYLNAFFETGYVYNKYSNSSNRLPNAFLTSAGLGLDMVAYYDLIIRLEYSINQTGNGGVFLNIGKAF